MGRLDASLFEQLPNKRGAIGAVVIQGRDRAETVIVVLGCRATRALSCQPNFSRHLGAVYAALVFDDSAG